MQGEYGDEHRQKQLQDMMHFLEEEYQQEIREERKLSGSE